jgi:hypothetical protein
MYLSFASSTIVVASFIHNTPPLGFDIILRVTCASGARFHTAQFRDRAGYLEARLRYASSALGQRGAINAEAHHTRGIPRQD